jgi:flagellar biosynthesis/type III secretory pathway M-ring protein FliF/YscJ
MITRARPRRSPEPERASPLQEVVAAALDDMKAVNVKVLDVRGQRRRQEIRIPPPRQRG